MNGSNPCGPSSGFRAPSPKRGRPGLRVSCSPSPRPYPAMVGMARCAVPARVAAGGARRRATLAFEELAPLHAARTSQRDVPTTLKHICGTRVSASLHGLDLADSAQAS